MQQRRRHPEVSRRYNADRRQKFRDAGLCYHCGKNRADRGKCSECRMKQNRTRDRTRNAENARQWRLRRRELGLCDKCNESAVTGKTLCEYHRELRWRQNNRHRMKAAIVSEADYVPSYAATPVNVSEGKRPWYESFDCETSVTVWELAEVMR